MEATDSTNELQFYLDIANMGRWTYSIPDATLTCDQRCAEFLGINDGKLSFDALVNCADSEDQPKLARCFAKSGEVGKSFAVSFKQRQPGDWRTVTLKGQWLSTSNASGILNVEDLTDGVIQLSESELISQVVDAIPFAVMYITRDGRVDFTNRTFRYATGTTAVQTERRPVDQVLDTEERENGTKAFMECLKTGRHTSRAGETAVDGKPIRYCKYVYEPVKNRDGNVLGVVSTVVDITNLKNAERALEASNKDLARSNEDLEQFAYVASHDLKAPLRSIEVLAGWLAEDLADFEVKEVHDNLNLLKQRTARLNRLLEDLLGYSRAGREIGEQSQTDCTELVEDIVTLLNVPAAFNVSSSDLPVITTYAVPLEQVLRNLISNSIKHHPGPAGTISVSAEEHDDHYLFSVTDDGGGIPEEYAGKVFEMFQTLRPRDEVEGSGMGLAIVNRIITRRGGRIWFEPVPNGTGTVFKFEWKFDQSESGDISRKDAA